MTQNKMFPFITKTWNPIGGECKHQCRYCWVNPLKKKFPLVDIKYSGEPHLYEKAFEIQFKETDTVFVGDMTDMFGEWVPSWMIQKVIDHLWKGVRANSQTQYLFLTKNPRRYFEFFFPSNVTLGATIETECDPSLCGANISKAPTTMERIRCMKGLISNPKFISIEPIMEFSPGAFIEDILSIKPDYIAVGFDNYNHKLPEPESLEKVEKLIQAVEKAGIKVYRKTIREPVPEEEQIYAVPSLGVKST